MAKRACSSRSLLQYLSHLLLCDRETELGGFYPPITVSNVTQGASYCVGWFSIADGKRVCSVCTRQLLALSQKHSAFGGNSHEMASG